jgi:LPXTG-motif cell wall-anchored protein
VTATSGSLPNTAVVTSPSGTGGRPHTPGPVITTQTVASPGSPAEGPNGQLPRTGLETGGVALGLALLGGGAFLYRRRRTV